jgi:hypothetical protein
MSLKFEPRQLLINLNFYALYWTCSGIFYLLHISFPKSDTVTSSRGYVLEDLKNFCTIFYFSVGSSSGGVSGLLYKKHQHYKWNKRSEVHTFVLVKIQVFWDVMWCSPGNSYWCFGLVCFLHRQGLEGQDDYPVLRIWHSCLPVTASSMSRTWWTPGIEELSFTNCINSGKDGI